MGKGSEFCQIISPEAELIAITCPYPSTKISLPSKYESPPLINSYSLTPSFFISILKIDF